MEFQNENSPGAAGDGSKEIKNNDSPALTKGNRKNPVSPVLNDEKLTDRGQVPNNVPVRRDTPELDQANLPGLLPNPALTLDAKIMMVSDLHRKCVQRFALIGRMQSLEEFELNLADEADELGDNPYQNCKLIIRDDKNREFVTNTPGLIRMVKNFLFGACAEKLKEIESAIVFPQTVN